MIIFHSTTKQNPALPRSSVRIQILQSHGVNSSPSLSEGSAIPVPTPACFCLCASPARRREARTAPSRLNLRGHKREFSPGTLTLFALGQGRVPPGAGCAGAALGTLQGVPRVAGEGHNVQNPVVIATRGHRPIADMWEDATDGWERERREILPAQLAGFLQCGGVCAVLCP